MNAIAPIRREWSGGSRIVAGAVLALVCAASTACLPGQGETAGMEALRAARETLGGDAFEEIQNLRVVSETRIRTPRGPVTLPFTLVVTPDGRFRLERGLSDGSTLTVVGDGEGMTIRDSKGVRSASAERRRQIAGQLWWRPAYLFVNMDRRKLEVTAPDTTKVNGTTYRKIQISPPEGSPFVLLLDSESMRPARVKYTARTPRGTVEVTDVYHEFRDVSGLRLPYRMVTYKGDSRASETVYTSIEANVELEEGYFSLDAGEKGDTSGAVGGSSAGL